MPSAIAPRLGCPDFCSPQTPESVLWARQLPDDYSLRAMGAAFSTSCRGLPSQDISQSSGRLWTIRRESILPTEMVLQMHLSAACLFVGRFSAWKQSGMNSSTIGLPFDESTFAYKSVCGLQTDFYTRERSMDWAESMDSPNPWNSRPLLE
jgi:hypothetical protein